MIIALSGNRCVGKDTAFEHLSEYVMCTRYAFADALKNDLKDLIKNQFDIDIFNPTKEEKEFIRPMMIAYGCMWREKDPEHWVKIVIYQMQNNNTSHSVVVDLRFENELDELRRIFGKNLIHVHVSNTCAPSPTFEEEKHFRLVKERADYQINWGNNTIDERREIINELCTQFQLV